MANVAVSKANHVWVFCWAWPRFSCCFAALATKRMSGWGICGSSCCAMMGLFLLDLPFYWYWPIAHCTIFLTAYVSFRTVPQSIYGQSREKKSGTCSRFGLPRLCTKGLFGGLAWCRFCSSLTVWSIASSVTSLERVTFWLMLCSASSHSCWRVCPGLGSIYFLFHTELCDHRVVFRLISTELRWRLNSASMLFSSWIVSRLCMQNCLTAPSIDMGHPSGICDSSRVSPQLSIMVPSIGTSMVALKLIIARLLFQVSTALSAFEVFFGKSSPLNC